MLIIMKLFSKLGNIKLEILKKGVGAFIKSPD